MANGEHIHTYTNGQALVFLHCDVYVVLYEVVYFIPRVSYATFFYSSLFFLFFHPDTGENMQKRTSVDVLSLWEERPSAHMLYSRCIYFIFCVGQVVSRVEFDPMLPK